MLYVYIGTKITKIEEKMSSKKSSNSDFKIIERVQTGVRMEKRLVKVLKGLAEYLEISMGDLLEGIVLHAFDNKTPFSENSLKKISQLKDIYGMDYDSNYSHKMKENE